MLNILALLKPSSATSTQDNTQEDVFVFFVDMPEDGLSTGRNI